MSGPFEALGDATRRRILVLLAAGERPAGELVAALREQASISQPAVSQHLRTLLAAGLVTVRAEGRRRVYAVDADGLAGTRAWLAGLDPLAGVRQPLDALATEVARGNRAGRHTNRRPGDLGTYDVLRSAGVGHLGLPAGLVLVGGVPDRVGDAVGGERTFACRACRGR